MKYKIYEIISIATDMYDMDYNTIFDCILRDTNTDYFDTQQEALEVVNTLPDNSSYTILSVLKK